MGIHFDGTVSLGSLISTLAFLLAAAAAWTDVRWRIKNLERWRTEHTEDSNKRDELIRKLDLANEHLTTLITERRRLPRSGGI